MLLTLRGQFGSSARAAADSVISALTPAAWYRNATGITESGGFVSQWDDYSGNARHLVQGVGTNQPAYSAGVLTFDGVDNRMVATSWSMVQPVTIYFVGKQVTWTSADSLFDGTVNVSGVVYQDPATPSLRTFAGTAGVGDNGNLAVNTRGIICTKFNGVSSSTRVNNTAATTGDAGASNMGGFVLGSRGTAGQYSNIAVEEVVLFAAAHDDATQSSVITALNNALTVF